jgi:hypothetical protein
MEMNSDNDQLDELIEASAKLNRIPLTPEMQPLVRMHFEIAARMAEQLNAFPMDEREEPAPVFMP